MRLPNGNLVVATELTFGEEPIKHKDDWRVVIIPIAYAIKNFIGKLNHDFNYSATDLEEEVESPKQDASLELPEPEQEAPADTEEPIVDEELADEIEF